MHVRVTDLFVILILKRFFLLQQVMHMCPHVFCVYNIHISNITCVNHISSMFNSELSYISFIF